MGLGVEDEGTNPCCAQISKGLMGEEDPLLASLMKSSARGSISLDTSAHSSVKPGGKNSSSVKPGGQYSSMAAGGKTRGKAATKKDKEARAIQMRFSSGWEVVLFPPPPPPPPACAAMMLCLGVLIQNS